MKTSYKIDFLPADSISGKEDNNSVQVICVYSGLTDKKTLIVFQAGSTDNAQQAVLYIQQHYQTRHIDHLVCSKLSDGFNGGLTVFLEKMQVLNLWLPPDALCSDLAQKHTELQPKIQALKAVKQLALSRNIPVHQTFQGTAIGAFSVLSPQTSAHVAQPGHSPSSGQNKKTSPFSPAYFLSSLYSCLPSRLHFFYHNNFLLTALRDLAENLGFETLSCKPVTSIENEHSLILFAVINGQGILLTSDAGEQALSTAADYMANRGIKLADYLRFIVMPNNGNPQHISPKILDRLIGEKSSSPKETKRATVLLNISSKNILFKQQKALINALKRRNVKVLIIANTMFYQYQDGILEENNLKNRK